MKVKAITPLIVAALLMAVCVTPVYANGVPPLPHAFYGGLSINDNPAPAGTTVEARGQGVRIDISGNPIVTTEAGEYGSADPLGAKLVVQGDIADGATLYFYVDDVDTGQTAEWHSGEVSPLALSVSIVAPGPVYWPPGARTYYIETDLFGSEARFRISSDGEILQTITATSADGNLIITIPIGTIALDRYGNPLSTLSSNIDLSPPPPPEDAHIIGLAYDFGPDGATFEPPITFTWSYDPQALPEGVAEADLVIAYYDEDAGEWVELVCVVDTRNDTITAWVSHFNFTTFAIIGSITPPEEPLPEEPEEEPLPEEPDEEPTVPPVAPAPAAFRVSSLSVEPQEVRPGEEVTIDVAVTNTGGTQGSHTLVLKINEVEESPRRTVTIEAGDTLNLIFLVTRQEAGSYTIAVNGLSGSFTVVSRPFPWLWIGSVVVLVALAGLLAAFLLRRKKAPPEKV